jgi:SH3-like domain-containing protein
MVRQIFAAVWCAAVVAAGGAALAQEAKETGRRSWDGTIAARTLNVRAGPGEGYDVVARLERGAKVVAFDQDGRWIAIRGFDEDGVEGWVHRSFIRLPADFMAPAFGDAENAFLEWASERGDLAEVSVEADAQISMVLDAGIADARAAIIAREVACEWRERLAVETPVIATVWPAEGPTSGWIARVSCP